MLRKKKHVYCHHASEYEIQFFDVDSMNIMWHIWKWHAVHFWTKFITPTT